MRDWKIYRLLVMMCGLVLLGMWYERVAEITTTANERMYGGRVPNYPEEIGKLYAGTAETEYLLGRRKESTMGSLRTREAVRKELESVLQHYERALALGLRSNENLVYNHALTLMRLQAEPERIDAAIATWRRDFPHSTRADLALRREAIEDAFRRLELQRGATATPKAY